MLPLCAEKARDKAREERKEKISPPLDPTAVSELVIRVLWWWARTWWSGFSGVGHVSAVWSWMRKARG